MLNDGKWHTGKEIQQKMKLKEEQIKQILTFLKEYSFVITDEKKGEVKLEESVRRFLTRSITS